VCCPCLLPTCRPAHLADPEIDAFPVQMGIKEKAADSFQKQAISAILFLHRHIVVMRILKEAKPCRRDQSSVQP
jgi:hypothetical protein